MSEKSKSESLAEELLKIKLPPDVLSKLPEGMDKAALIKKFAEGFTQVLQNFDLEKFLAEMELADSASSIAQLSEEAPLSLEEIMALAYEAGVEAGEAVPESLICGRGSVILTGDQPVRDPVLESPFGQDYRRHEAFVQAAMEVLREYGVQARMKVELD
jgi:hypothetical protein